MKQFRRTPPPNETCFILIFFFCTFPLVMNKKKQLLLLCLHWQRLIYWIHSALKTYFAPNKNICWNKKYFLKIFLCIFSISVKKCGVGGIVVVLKGCHKHPLLGIDQHLMKKYRAINIYRSFHTSI